jgi:hypothetical protein
LIIKFRNNFRILTCGFSEISTTAKVISSLTQKPSKLCFLAILEDCTILIEGVDDEYGASLILSEIIEATKAPEMKTRKAAASLIKVFVEKTEADYMEYYGVLFRELIRLMTDPEGSPTLELAWSSLQTLVKSLDAVELQRNGYYLKSEF